MNRSESTANLAAALAKAQVKLRNPHFDSQNPHFRSKFASLAAVRESVVPVLASYGIAITQWPVSESNFAGCVTHILHESGEWMEEKFLIPVEKGNAHGYASAVTYAKRISMQSVAAVVGDEDDDGNAAVETKQPTRISGAAINKESFDKLEDDEKAWIEDLAFRITKLTNSGDYAGAIQERDIAIPHAPPGRPEKYEDYMNGLMHVLESSVKTKLYNYKTSLNKKAA